MGFRQEPLLLAGQRSGRCPPLCPRRGQKTGKTERQDHDGNGADNGAPVYRTLIPKDANFVFLGIIILWILETLVTSFFSIIIFEVNYSQMFRKTQINLQ